MMQDLYSKNQKAFDMRDLMAAVGAVLQPGVAFGVMPGR